MNIDNENQEMKALPQKDPANMPPLIMTIAIDRRTGQLGVSDNVLQESAYEDVSKLSEALGIMSERLKEVLITMAKEAGKKEAREALIAEEVRKVKEREAKNRRRNGKEKHEEAPLILKAGGGVT